LLYARLQKPAALESVSCKAIFEQVKADLADQLAASKAMLSAEALPDVIGDSDRLYQLLLNLVANANKFRRTGEVPQIRIFAEERKREWTFCVEDNGIGVEPEYSTVIFDAFRQLHSQSAYEGSGLGLMICRQIVEQHGGRIWVESEPKSGSRFYFTLQK